LRNRFFIDVCQAPKAWDDFVSTSNSKFDWVSAVLGAQEAENLSPNAALSDMVKNMSSKLGCAEAAVSQRIMMRDAGKYNSWIWPVRVRGKAEFHGAGAHPGIEGAQRAQLLGGMDAWCVLRATN
jgi:hypothetical protein